MAALQWSGLIMAIWTVPASAGGLQDIVDSIAGSELIFKRSTSNVPFFPVAFLNTTHYGDTEVRDPSAGGRTFSYQQTAVSQAAALPFLISPRDLVAVGEWISWSRFDANASQRDSFDVVSVGIPVGWMRQVDDAWQTAAFAMPLGHKSSLSNSSWRWEYMAGAFARYVQNDDLWWVFGAFADVGPDEDIYLPYFGAAWAITEQWEISAILPWPTVSYAPSRDTLFQFGATPSGSSWSVRQATGDVYFNLDAWDLGLSAERRVSGNLWARVQVGVGGLRGLRIAGGAWESPDFDIGTSPFISVGINYRPALLQ